MKIFFTQVGSSQRNRHNDPDGKPVLTGADGTVTIPVRNQGLNVIVAILDSSSEEPKKYDRLEHLATLSFVLPHAPE